MGGKRWTPEEAIAAGAQFVEINRRLPTDVDMRGGGLPNYPTVARLFGSLVQYQHALPKPPPKSPALAKRACLMCEQPFRPEHSGLYVCNPCKLSDDWKETTDWMNNDAPALWKPPSQRHKKGI